MCSCIQRVSLCAAHFIDIAIVHGSALKAMDALAAAIAKLIAKQQVRL